MKLFLKNQNTITDLYTPANPSVPMAVPLQSMQAAGFKIIPTITDGTDIDPKTGKIKSIDKMIETVVRASGGNTMSVTKAFGTRGSAACHWA